MGVMRLTELKPRFYGAGGEGVFQRDAHGHLVPAPERTGIGLSFDCPCPSCAAQREGDSYRDFHLRISVSFENPLDGGPPLRGDRPLWTRTGDTFETITLKPSILVRDRCGWHGFVRNGEVIDA